MEKSGVDGAEGGRICAYSQCNGQQGYCAEPGIPEHHPGSIAKVLENVHYGPPCDGIV